MSLWQKKVILSIIGRHGLDRVKSVHMSKSSENAGKKPLSRSLRVYQKIAIFFVIISFILLLFVLYLSISAATIKITPVPQVVSSETSIEVVPEAINDSQVTGYVILESFSQSRSFALPEEGAVAQEGKAGGTVTLINETNSDQALVVNTRVLSEEGILFRLDEPTVVPAGGQVDAIVHADEAGVTGEIGPSQFTIPGLSASLQEVIYAVSVDSMTGGVEYVRSLTEQDLEMAVLELSDEMLEGAKTEIAKNVDTKTFDGAVYNLEIIERVSDTEPGTEAGSFIVSITADVTGVFYDSSVVEQYMEASLQASVSNDYEVVEIAGDGLQLEIRSIDADSESAVLGAYLDGVAVVSSTSDVLDKERLLGRSPNEVITLLESSALIEKVNVTFTPFWLKRIPSLKDHIKIIVVY